MNADKYLSEYRVPGHQAYRYIFRKIKNDLMEEMGVTHMKKRLIYEFSVPCKLCGHYSDNSKSCMKIYQYKINKCSFYKARNEYFNYVYGIEMKLEESIHSVIEDEHVNLYILIKVAQRKLVEYKKQINA